MTARSLLKQKNVKAEGLDTPTTDHLIEAQSAKNQARRENRATVAPLFHAHFRAAKMIKEDERLTRTDNGSIVLETLRILSVCEVITDAAYSAIVDALGLPKAETTEGEK